jgi:hypothetical protein
MARHTINDPRKVRALASLKNRILLENYNLPGDLEAQIEAFIIDYNNLRYHESIGNLMPTHVYRQLPIAACCNITSQTRRARDYLT